MILLYLVSLVNDTKNSRLGTIFSLRYLWPKTGPAVSQKPAWPGTPARRLGTSTRSPALPVRLVVQTPLQPSRETPVTAPVELIPKQGRGLGRSSEEVFFYCYFAIVSPGLATPLEPCWTICSASYYLNIMSNLFHCNKSFLNKLNEVEASIQQDFSFHGDFFFIYLLYIAVYLSIYL